MSIISPFYFPTTILCVDDNKIILEILQDKLAELNYKIQVYTDPQEAIQAVKNNSTAANGKYLNDLTASYDYHGLDVINSSILEFNFSTFLDIFNNTNRFNELSVIIVDYLMPQINGVELCKQISYSLAKKILLTAAADEAGSIKAFNDNLINCYIKKGEDATMSQLISYVNRLTRQYFIDKTLPISTYLENIGLTTLSDSVFINFFEELISKYNILEYYLIDKNGSFLLINNKNEKLVLTIHNNNSLDELIDLFVAEPMVTRLIKAMQQRLKIPFFGLSKNPANIPLEEWEKHFYPAELLEGQQQYYWSLISLEGRINEHETRQ